jgi:hypothetical protein
LEREILAHYNSNKIKSFLIINLMKEVHSIYTKSLPRGTVNKWRNIPCPFFGRISAWIILGKLPSLESVKF